MATIQEEKVHAGAGGLQELSSVDPPLQNKWATLGPVAAFAVKSGIFFSSLEVALQNYFLSHRRAVISSESLFLPPWHSVSRSLRVTQMLLEEMPFSLVEMKCQSFQLFWRTQAPGWGSCTTWQHLQEPAGVLNVFVHSSSTSMCTQITCRSG